MKFDEVIRARSGTGGERKGDTLGDGARGDDLRMVLAIVKTLNRSLDPDEVLELVLKSGIRVAKAERGFLLLANSEGNLQCVMARDAAGKSLKQHELTLSQSVAEDAFRNGESICVEHAQSHDRFDQRQSIVSLGLETILCSPLAVRDERIGVIYVDSRHIQPVNKNEIVDLFEIFAGQAAIAIKNSQLYDKLHKAFEDLQVANEKLMKFERIASKGEAAAEISHELNNLVGIILLQIEMLNKFFRKYSPEECESKLGQILRSAMRIRAFASGLVETSALKTRKQIGDLNETVSSIVRYVRPLSKYQRSVLFTTLDKRIPQFGFDPLQIQQVILNFLNNAVEAYSQATIEIQTAYLVDTGEAQVIVKDNGPGLVEEVRKKLFVERVTTKPEGHGYGLPICKKIIENHGGHISVRSIPTQETVFTITLRTA